MPFQLSKINHDDSDTCFFLYSFIYLSKSHHGNKNSKTTKARNLKFGQIIGLYMDLCHCNFGGATSRGLGHMHPKLMTAKFIKWFYSHTRASCHGRMVKVARAWNLRPGFNTLLDYRFHQTNITLNLAYYFFSITTKSFMLCFCLTLHMIREYQVSFSVKTFHKSASKDLKLVR